MIDQLSRQAANATHYLVFGACRNELNVSGANAKAIGSEKGFVPVADISGLLIAYATAPKRTASDAGEGGGPYARVLSEQLLVPGVESVSMFRNVQLRVKQSIGQDPWLSFPSVPEVYLAGRSVAAPTSPPAPVLAPAVPSTGWSAAEREWQQYAKDTRDLGLLDAFKKKHAQDPVYVRLADARIELLRREAEETRTRAERERAAALEEQRREEARKAATSEAPRDRKAVTKSIAPPSRHSREVGNQQASCSSAYAHCLRDCRVKGLEGGCQIACSIALGRCKQFGIRDH